MHSSSCRACAPLLPKASGTAQLQVCEPPGKASQLSQRLNILLYASDCACVTVLECETHTTLYRCGDCSGAHGLAQKMYNWCTLNQKVFKRLGFVVAKSECQACASCQPGAIERVLKLVRLRLSRFAEGPAFLLTNSVVKAPSRFALCCPEWLEDSSHSVSGNIHSPVWEQENCIPCDRRTAMGHVPTQRLWRTFLTQTSMEVRQRSSTQIFLCRMTAGQANHLRDPLTMPWLKEMPRSEL